MENNDLFMENCTLKLKIAEQERLIKSYQALVEEMRNYKTYALEVKHGVKKITEPNQDIDKQIIELSKKGCTVNSIADTLGVSSMTVRRHIKRMQEIGIRI